MNDAQALEWLAEARKAGACNTRLAPYEAKAAAGELKVSDMDPKDAVWMLCLAKNAGNRKALKALAGNTPEAVWVDKA
jgi:hypothetical protein